MRTLEELHSYARKNKTMSPHIPFSSPVTEHIVKLKNGNGYLTVFEVEGVDFVTCGEEQIDAYNNQLHQLLMMLDGGKYAIWSHKVRRKVQETLPGEYDNAFCEQVASAYEQRLSGMAMYRTTHYLTLVYRPNEQAVFKEVGFGSVEAFVEHEKNNIAVLEQAASLAASLLKTYKPVRLGNTKKGSTEFSNLLSFLGFLVNGHWEDIPTSRTRLDDYLPTSTLTFGERSGVIQIQSTKGTKYASVVEIKEYRKKVSAVSLSKLLYLSQEFIETQSFSIVHDVDSVEKFRRQKSQMLAGGEASEEEIADMEKAIESLRKKAVCGGEYHYSMIVFSDTPQGVRKDQNEVIDALAKAEFKAVPQGELPEAAWFFQLPGNWRYRTRLAFISSLNFAALNPLHNFMSGKRSGNPWGDALGLFVGPSGQPYYLNFHASPEDQDSSDAQLPGNTVMFGQTGTGKTTLEMFLICCLSKYHATVVLMDFNRSAEIGMRAVGATYRTFKRGEPTGMNPFQWPESRETIDFCRAVTIQCMTKGGADPLNADEEQLLSSAIETVFRFDIDKRRLALVYQNLPPVAAPGRSSLQARLRRWVNDGDLAWVIDNPTDTLKLDSAHKFGFDFTEFIDDPEICPPFTMCLLHISKKLMKGQPFALFMEEFWKPLQHAAFSDFVKEELKTIRMKSGLVCLTTQQPDDVLDHPLAKTAVQQCITGIYLPNDKASYEDYVEGFKLTPAEFDFVRSFPRDSRAFLVKQNNKSAIVKFDLTGFDDVISILSGSRKNLVRLDRIRASVGDNAEHWMPLLFAEIHADKVTAEIGEES